MFRGGEAEIRSIAAHDVHKNVGIIKEGGTIMLLYGTLVAHYNFKHYGKDDTGLGRWMIMLFKGYKRIKTRIVCGYNLCYNKKM